MAEAGGSAATWQVLLLVRSQKWDKQSSMAEAMGITAATLTHHLNALEKQGLVRRWREEGNRRVAARRAHPARASRCSTACDASRWPTTPGCGRGFSAAELEQLAGLLDRLQANVELISAAAPSQHDQCHGHRPGGDAVHE